MSRYKIETSDVTIDVCGGRSEAILKAREASTWVDTEVGVYKENPMWVTGDQLVLGRWVRLGYALEGDFYGDA